MPHPSIFPFTVFLLLVCFSFSNALAKSPAFNVDNVRFKRVLDDHDVALGAMLSIVQDEKGFVWFGGIGGLVRYDGYELMFVGLTDDPNDSIKSVHHVIEGENDTFWIASSYGLMKFDKRTERYSRYTQSKDSPISLSQNYINKLLLVKNRYLITGTYGGIDLLDLKKQTVVNLQPNPEDPASAFVFAFHNQDNRNIWLGTGVGIYLFDLKKHRFKKLVTNSEVDNTSIRDFAFDQKGGVWLASDSGLHKLDIKSKKVTSYHHDPENPESLGANTVWTVLYDDGYVWAGTDQGGLSLLELETGRIKRLKNSPANPKSLGSNTVKTLFKDRSGNLWTGNFPEGIHFFDRSTTVASLHSQNPLLSSSLSHNSVMAFEEDEDGLWIGTDGGGLNYYNRKSGQYAHYLHDPQDDHSLRSNAVLALLKDSKGRLWTGTWGGGLCYFDERKKRLIRKVLRRKPDGSEERFNVWSLAEDSYGDLWVGTQMQGLLRYSLQSGALIQYKPNNDDKTSLSGEAVWTIFEDSAKRLWVGTNHGLNLFDRESGGFKHFKNSPTDSRSLSQNSVQSILEDRRGRLWLGTEGGLNVMDDENRFTRITRKDGLVSDVVKSLLQGPDGRIWLGTSNGISSIDPETLALNNYRPHIGWQKGSFNGNAAMIDGAGRLLFGGVNGFMVFDPAQLEGNNNIPPVVFTQLRVDTQRIRPGDDSLVLKQSLAYADSIVLPDTQQMFELDFSALNYRDTRKNQYEYRLEGFDNSWRKIGTRHSATYTNLPKGNYVFRVRASNNDGVWNKKGASLRITIP